MTNYQFPMPNKLPMTNIKLKKFDIKERTFQFAVKIAEFVNKLPKKQSLIEYSRQLIRASASIGANLEEADGALSKKDFINKMGISRREAKESRYWLALIKEVELVGNPEIKEKVDWLINESMELKLILSSIINKTESNIKLDIG